MELNVNYLERTTGLAFFNIMNQIQTEQIAIVELIQLIGRNIALSIIFAFSHTT